MDSSLTQPPDANASTPVLSFLALSSFGSTFGSTFGAFMIGTYFSLMLYGITLRQTFQYFHTYRGDTAVVKFLVLAIFLVDTFHTATLVDTCYYYFVTNYFDPFGLLVFTWSVQVLPLTIGIVVLLTQSFYVRRIYLVNKRYLPIVLLVATLMLVEFSFIIASSVESFKHDTFERMDGRIWMYSTLFAIATTVDFILTGALVVILRKNYTRFER